MASPASTFPSKSELSTAASFFKIGKGEAFGNLLPRIETWIFNLGVAISVIFIWIGRLLERGPLSIVFAFGLIANGSVFEMGLVQFSQILSGSAKMLAFIWVAKVFYKFMRNDKSKRI